MMEVELMGHVLMETPFEDECFAVKHDSIVESMT